MSLEQTLHGYRDGHELLASSCDLPRTARRQMLVLSDLSGDEMVRGFREYLTGYPIEGTDLFAFAKTWYASEMPRPGCVWTHTIMIPPAVIASLVNLHSLVEMFQRPSGRFEEYEQPIRTTPSVEDIKIDERFEGFAGEVIAELFSSASAPALIAAEHSSTHEHLVCGIWSQLYEKLRQRFFFSTGSLDFRTWEGRPFDLQVVPSDRWRRIARHAGLQLLPVFFHDDRKNPVNKVADVPLWANVLARELTAPNVRFRELLNRLATGMPPERRTFRVVVEATVIVDQLVNGGRSVNDLVAFLAGALDGRDGISLKVALLGPNSEFLPGVSEQEVLRPVLSTRYANAFPFEELNIPERVRHICAPRNGRDLAGLEWLCNEEDISPAGVELRQAVLRELSLDQLLTIHGYDRELLRRVLILCPWHLGREVLWNQPREIQRTALTALQEAHPYDVASACQAIVRAPQFAIASELMDSLRDRGSVGLLMALNAAIGEGTSVNASTWSVALSRHPDAVAEWLSAGNQPIFARTLTLLDDIGSGHGFAFRRIVPLAVLDGMRVEENLTHSAYDDPDNAARALAIGFTEPSIVGAQIASRVFERVHDAVMKSRLSWKAWRRLDDLVPRAGMFAMFDWDHAEKLRRALVDRFIERPEWPAELFAEAITTPDTRRRVVDYCRGRDRGTDLLRRSGMYDRTAER